MRKILIAAIACFALAACVNPSASPGTVPPPDAVETAGSTGGVVQIVTKAGETVAVRGTQALIIAEEWYQPANRAALAAVQTGALPQSVLRQILDLNRAIRAALDRGKGLSDDAGRAAAAAEAMRSIVSLRALVGGSR